MRISFFYSATEAAIIAVQGSKFEAGAIATAFDGTTDAGSLKDGAEPMAVIEDVIKQFRSEPAAVPLYFMIKGGVVNDNPRSGYELLASVDLSDDSEASPEYVGE